MTASPQWGKVEVGATGSPPTSLRAMPSEEVTTIQTPLFLPAFDALITEILVSHGATVEREEGGSSYLITFPAETYKTEQLLRTHDEKYCIEFPDGFQIYEMKRRGDHSSYLRFNTLDFTPEQRATLDRIIGEGEEKAPA